MSELKVTEEMKQRIQAVLIHDPLFTVVRDTPKEEVLYSDSYLAEIIEKKFYSIAEVARGLAFRMQSYDTISNHLRNIFFSTKK